MLLLFALVSYLGFFSIINSFGVAASVCFYADGKLVESRRSQTFIMNDFLPARRPDAGKSRTRDWERFFQFARRRASTVTAGQMLRRASCIPGGPKGAHPSQKHSVHQRWANYGPGGLLWSVQLFIRPVQLKEMIPIVSKRLFFMTLEFDFLFFISGDC